MGGGAGERGGAGIQAELESAKRLCFDTSALIYYLNRSEPHALAVRQLFEEVRYGRREGLISVVSEVELLVRPLRDGSWLDVERARLVVEAPNLRVVDFDRTIARTTAEVRARTRLRLPDAAIVATAMVSGCDAIVGNDARCAERVRELPYLLLDELVGQV